MSRQADSGWTRLTQLVTEIVAEAKRLKDKHTDEADARVSYCAIFCKNENEYSELKNAAEENGKLANDTATGPVFVVSEIPTVAGVLRVVKIRKPDPTREERGDADFALEDYERVKAQHLRSAGFTLIERQNFEMIELTDDEFDARVYFSNPPVDEHAGIREALAE